MRASSKKSNQNHQLASGGSSLTIIPSLLLGLASGIGFAAMHHLLLMKNNNNDFNNNDKDDNSCISIRNNNKDNNNKRSKCIYNRMRDEYRNKFMSKFKGILKRINRKTNNRNINVNVDWSTLLMLYTISQLKLKPKHAARASLVAVPFLYLILSSDDDDDDDGNDDGNDDKTNPTDNNSARISGINSNPILNTITRTTKTTCTATIHVNADNILKHQQQHPANEDKYRSRSNSVLTQTDASEDSHSVSVSVSKPSPPVRYCEILVHNVAHTDLVLCLGIPPELQSNAVQRDRDDRDRDKDRHQHQHQYHHPDMDQEMDLTPPSPTPTATATATPFSKIMKQKVHFQEEEAHALCRPRFSAFDMFCRRILHVLHNCMDDGVGHGDGDDSNRKNDNNNGNGNEKHWDPQEITRRKQEKIKQLYASIMSFPKYERSDSTARFSLVTPKTSKQTMLPVGFNLAQLAGETDLGSEIRTNVNMNMKATMADSSVIRGKDKLDLKLDLALTQEDVASLRVRGRDMSKMEGVVAAGCWPSSSSPRRYADTDTDINTGGEGQSLSQTQTQTQTKGHDAESHSPLHLEAIFFPLLSSLLRRWHRQITEKYGSVLSKNVKKVLILVSGVGTPRNWTHSISGNSTEACAELMEMFIKVLYPDVVVVRVHSQREIFRYDENITFANEELLPCIDAYRDAHARGERYPDEVVDGDWATTSSTNPFDPDWKQTFALTLSFADGAPARTHAIQSSLRPYRPTYFHFWQLKTFWHDSKICDDDIEVHSFESMETVPAMEVQKTHSDVQRVVEEMKRFRQDFIKSLSEGDNDIRTFWLRKTKKPVLAVLLVNRPGKGPIVYRGTNMEVSMPTGSLCAERNVIGTALATNPGLRREDLMMVAVLAIPLANDGGPVASTPQQLPSPPPGSNQVICTVIGPRDDFGKESSVFFSEVEEKLSRYQRPENFRRSMSIGSFASIVERSDDSNETDDSSWEKMPATDKLIPESPPPVSKATKAFSANVHSLPIPEIISDSNDAPSNSNSGVSTPLRKIKLYGGGEVQHETSSKSKFGNKRNKKRTVIVHSSEDLNPLKPCGACNEWLKKISESNPYFKVITFTDTDCNGVYVSPCQE